jgi:hypothetical protein
MPGYIFKSGNGVGVVGGIFWVAFQAFSRISAEVCETSPHNSVNLLCKWLVYFEKLLFTLF